MTVDPKFISGLLLLLPRLLVVKRIELDVIDGAGAGDDREFAVEKDENLVSVLDVVLVRGDRDDLVSRQSVLTDPVLHVA